MKPTPSLALGEAAPHNLERSWLGGHQLLLRGLEVGGREEGRDGEAGARGAGSDVTQLGVAASEVFVFSF